MSHCPGPYLEDFLCWNYSIVDAEGRHEEPIVRFYACWRIVTAEQLAGLVAIWEPQRGAIEKVLDNFDEEECGWRTYASEAFGFIPDEVYQAGTEYLKSLGELPKTKGLSP